MVTTYYYPYFTNEDVMILIPYISVMIYVLQHCFTCINISCDLTWQVLLYRRDYNFRAFKWLVQNTISSS